MCREEEIAGTLGPCGHAVDCVVCAGASKLCPVCQAPVSTAASSSPPGTLISFRFRGVTYALPSGVDFARMFKLDAASMKWIVSGAQLGSSGEVLERQRGEGSGKPAMLVATAVTLLQNQRLAERESTHRHAIEWVSQWVLDTLHTLVLFFTSLFSAPAPALPPLHQD